MEKKAKTEKKIPAPVLVDRKLDTCELDRAKMSLMNPKVIKEKSNERTIDELAKVMLEHTMEEGIETVWDRFEMQQPQCSYCSDGLSCSRCAMGPCRIIPEHHRERGVCGADADLVVSRNLLDTIATGAAAHSDHGRDIVETLYKTGTGEAQGYEITDVKKLEKIAGELGVETKGRKKEEIATDVGRQLLYEFGTFKNKVTFADRAPEQTKEIWKAAGIVPRSVDREIVEAMHRVHMGVGANYANILLHGLRASLGDGWGGSMMGTDISDVLFGTPTINQSQVNLGVLKEDHVNISLHGHNPMLSEMIVRAANDPDMKALAEKTGAKGINLVGLCCTGNELLMRKGVPMAGNHFNQELIIATGALEAMVIDYQCIFPSLPRTASCYHTKIISTSEKSKVVGSYYFDFHPENAYDTAKAIVKMAINNFPNRIPERVLIPGKPVDLMAGFSVEAIVEALGGTVKPLIDVIASGDVRGAVGIVGCNNPKVQHDYGHVTLAKELIKNDILCVETGCAAVACGKAGLLMPDAAFLAGPGLKGVCKKLGIPPVLHMGSCVDCSRILVLLAELAKALGVGIDQLPAAGAAPEWYSQKAVSIGSYFVASGVYTVLGVMPKIAGSDNVVKLLTSGLNGVVNASFAVEPDPVAAAELITKHIDEKRKALGI
ncbi:anaerobic carbon-monoxide dehydrogenase catalytic subunit [Methanolacinia paynteri]|uniref:anaerobic carbon-monoxide dehydrogenase catalytic subunit n=1 Tax=Methanolacinia paynteri TaxID=230356 RepID=UPI000A002B32|nr:anaerobic carbon-monoxide dehydrogenase catalytic subunit [Methanolacinia paynteri]